jgi:8-oxo-dGTP diphosphatase
MKAEKNKQAERQFLENYDPGEFERPSVTIDVVMLTVVQGDLRLLVLRRAGQPFQGRWALPGGFVHMDETLDQAAARILQNKTQLSGFYLEQLYTFGDPGRDPRMRVITVAYVALVNWDRLVNFEHAADALLARVHVPWEGEQGGDVALFDSDDQLELAFDHAKLVGTAIKRLRGKLNYVPIGFQLLPELFSLRALQEIHETILGRSLNKDSFRRRMLDSGLIRSTKQREQGVGHRPAMLYRFKNHSAL